jgi:hypothetical protein
MILAKKLKLEIAFFIRACIATSLFLCVSLVTAQSANDPGQKVTAIDRHLSVIYQKTQRIRHLVDLLNYHSTFKAFGSKEKLPQVVVRVDGVQLHSLYFQVLSLKRRSSIHSFEQLRLVNELQQLFDASVYSNIDSQIILDLLDQIESELLEVAKNKKVQLPKLEAKMVSAVSASDVFVSLLSANREFDNLLIQGFQPNDVYQQVVQAINVTIQLLNHFDAAITVQKEPVYQYGKKPSDVWLKLHENMQILNQIAQKKGHIVFNLDIKDLSTDHILPRDVFQLATTIVSELSFLHHVIGSREPGIESVYVTNKTPSDVYQKASLLQEQLKMLLEASQQSKSEEVVLYDASQ